MRALGVDFIMPGKSSTNLTYKYSDLTARIIRCAMNVHSVLSNGYPEKMYQRALAVEFKCAGIPFDIESERQVYYKDNWIGGRRPDFVVFDKISVELKAIVDLRNSDLAQAINYLESRNLEIGLLLNFGARSLQFKRLTNRKFKPPA